MLQRSLRLGAIAVGAAGISYPALADVPSPGREIASSGLIWVVLGLVIVAALGVFLMRRKR